MTERGIVYIANDEYVEEAKISIKSVREVMPDIHIALMSNRDVEIEGVNKVISIGSRDNASDKVFNLDKTPYKKTIFLDPDTYVDEDITELFDLLDNFDLAAAHNPNRINKPLADVPSSFPMYNTGVMAFRKDDNIQEFFQTWRRIYEEMKKDYGMILDQLSFRKALFISESIRCATLTPEYNCRFNRPGYLQEEAKILHGRLLSNDKERGMERKVDIETARKKLTCDNDKRVHYVDKGILKIEKNRLSVFTKFKLSIERNGLKPTLVKSYNEVKNMAGL